MREILGLTVVWAALGAGMVSAAETRELHFKSPGPGMYFTAGLTVQVWADIIPRDDDHPGWPQAECRWDDLMVESRVSGNNKAYDYFPFTVPAAMVTPGIHTLKLNGFGRLGATNPPQRSMPVQVDPWPADKALVDLSEDRKYTDLNWTDVAVRGNGHTVTVSGKLTIKNSLVTGLGSMKIVDPSHADPKTVVMVPGMTGALSGNVDIRDSVFEATGALHLAINGGGDVAIRNNVYCENSEGILAEHNVLRASSWPLQSFGGEFRYNLMIDSGHNWVRTLTGGTRFHHNLLVHTGDPYGTGIHSGLWLYNNRKNVAIYNNTFDGGAPVARDFNAPIIALSSGCTLSTLRNNVFTGVTTISPLAGNAIVARGGSEKDNDPRVAYADYNCFFNPQAPAAASYDAGIVDKKDPGAHDVHADPRFAQGRLIPYAADEADVWNRNYKVSQVLALYRRRYAPAAGSSLLKGGDPADGKDSYIGAIGPGQDAAHDRFGRFSVQPVGPAHKTVLQQAEP